MIKDSLRLRVALAILGIFIGGSIILLSRIVHRLTPSPPEPRVAYSPVAKPAKSGTEKDRQIKPAARDPRVAIVMDDLGESEQDAQLLIDINIPLTFAILPQRPFSRTIAERLHSLGREIILHLPLEPEGDENINLGKGMLLLSMSREELLSGLREHLGSIPHISGINNHMGSAFTASEEGMRLVLGEIKERELFFLDNRTTVETVGLKIAREIGVRAAERDVFLDNEEKYEYISSQLDELIREARKKGQAIGTCHPGAVTIQVLGERLPGLSAQGIDFVPVSAFMR